MRCWRTASTGPRSTPTCSTAGDACLAELPARRPAARRRRGAGLLLGRRGLSIAVVGNEALVTAEAGRRVALSSGGRVVHVASGGLTRAGLRRGARLRAPTWCCWFSSDAFDNLRSSNEQLKFTWLSWIVIAIEFRNESGSPRRNPIPL